LKDYSVALEEGSEEINVPNRIKSADWLKENGMCIDNIKPMKSRITQAGRGAFATRSIKKGEVISPVPLVQIRREHLDVYEEDETEDSSKIRYGIEYCYYCAASTTNLTSFTATAGQARGKANNSELLFWSSGELCFAVSLRPSSELHESSLCKNKRSSSMVSPSQPQCGNAEDGPSIFNGS
jgi:hypothetical protein